eukprot:1137111-Pelagomonas_calceolata.AAC.6
MDRVGTKLTGKLNGALVVQPQLFRSVKGMLSITHPTNAQENGKSHSFCTSKFTEVCMLPVPPPTVVQASYAHAAGEMKKTTLSLI